MEGDFIKIRDSLLPLSWIYGGAVSLRNFCFEVGLLKSHAFNVPVISVGNITVGGTGKTPHVEYLVRLLKEKCKVAVLSRGYKRKTRGFLLADSHTTARDIGDEPFQMKQKFPDISVAVDRKRVHGIQQLTEDDSALDVILLDDAFQHRYVKPGINILLVDYHRLIIYDKLLPAGRLREPQKGKGRADIVIITKCPKDLKPMEFRVIRKAMDLYPYQHLFFTRLDYGNPYAVFGHKEMALDSIGNNNVLMLTGIASPRQLQEDMEKIIGHPGGQHIQALTYPDHHNFSRKDLEHISSTFDQMAEPKMIITTEKDAARLATLERLAPQVKERLYALPIHVVFMQQEQQEHFDNFITGYVSKNSRNSILLKKKDEESRQKEEERKENSKPAKPTTISFK